MGEVETTSFFLAYLPTAFLFFHISNCLNQVFSDLSDDIVTTDSRAALIHGDTALAGVACGAGGEDHADAGEGEGRLGEVGRVGAVGVAVTELPAILFRADVCHALDELAIGC